MQKNESKMNPKQKLNNNLKNIIGKSVKEKYVIIESDDWGSIRMPSLAALKRLKSKGLSLESGYSKRYNNTDTLASKKDFECLYEVLSKHKDVDGNSPLFTALSLVANPDFDKIKANNFTKYEYEPFPKTLKKYGEADALPMWKEGIDNNLFYPEFHGREHLNVNVWMRALQAGDKPTKLAFDEGLWAIKTETAYNINYQAAFDVQKKSDIEDQKQIISDGLELFEKLHGYKARYIVPPNGAFNNQLLETAAQNGIDFYGASKIQNEPQGQGNHKKALHWLGKINKFDQTTITRNAFFEPNEIGMYGVEDCLKSIHYAFKWNKPAVISSHRTNYIGVHNPKNREKGLRELDELLFRILKQWPDVKFITSTKLGEIISNKKFY